jgi:histidinol-phosphate/aromatic aminotransferase/cobyric acid decarboxylase-like protein
LTNFLYWDTGGVDAGALQARMAEWGVLIRAFHDPIEALRFSVGTPEQSDLVMAALEEAYAHVAG